MTDETILKIAEKELKELEPPKLWMTARGLSGRIRKRNPELGNLSQVRLFNILHAHVVCSVRPRKIRNSPYPSVKTLEVLWGAIDGDRTKERVVGSPHLQDENSEPNYQTIAHPLQNREDSEADEELETPPSHFLSYSFRDTPAANLIVDLLEQKRHSVWMAGAQIVSGEIINDRVIDAMKRSGGHLLYLSPCALESLWVGKETIVGKAMGLSPTIVVKSDDSDLMNLLRHWIGGGKSSSFGKIKEYRGASSQAARQFQDILKEYLRDQNKKIYLFPDGPNKYIDENERILNLSDFPVSLT